MKKVNFKKWLTIIMVATLVGAVSSCKDAPELTVAKTDIRFDGNNHYENVAVIAKNTDWTADVIDGDWINVQKIQNLVKISVEQNPNKNERSGSVQITATEDASIYQIISVTQEEGDSKLSVSSTTVNFNSSGGEKVVTINCNTDWDVSGSNDWLSVEKISDQSIKLLAQKNESSEKMEANINVYTTDGECTQEIKVTVAASELTLTISGLDAPFDASQGNIQTAQELTINCNSSWTISGKPEWLDISAMSGTGTSTVKVWPNSANNSTSERSATLTIKSGSKTITKKVVQRAGLDARLQVSPNTIVVLANGFAFDFNFGSNVKYYYVQAFYPSDLERITDDEIVAIMSSDPANRDTPSDSYVTSWRGLDPLTEYIICTVGYDENGNHGELKKTSITTKKGHNQAIALISNVEYDETSWFWSTTVNGFVTKYYQWFITRSDLHNASEAAIAWFFKQAMKDNPDDFPPIVQSTTWERNRNGGSIFHLATWALDVDGNFSGVIDNFAGHINSSSKSVRKNSVEKDNCLKRYKTIK